MRHEVMAKSNSKSNKDFRSPSCNWQVRVRTLTCEGCNARTFNLTLAHLHSHPLFRIQSGKAKRHAQAHSTR